MFGGPKLTEGQKKFREEIRKMEEEGVIEDKSEQRREERKRRRKMSTASKLFIAWNAFALSTWIAPLFMTSSPKRTPSSKPKTILSKRHTTSSEKKEAIDFIGDVSEIRLFFNEITLDINNFNSSREYDLDKLGVNIAKLEHYSAQLKNSSFRNSELAEHLIDSISIKSEILIEIYSSQYGNLDVDKYNSLINKSVLIGNEWQPKFIRFLEVNDIRYEIKNDGRVTYYK